jgi:hypothetical protein
MVVVLASCGWAMGQQSRAPSTAPPVANWTDWLGSQGGPRLRARLRDEAQLADAHEAAVEVEVENIWLRSAPVSDSGIAQGVLQYQLDQCAPVTTADTRLRFGQLSPGTHTIAVGVLNASNHLITPKAQLPVHIP